MYDSRWTLRQSDHILPFSMAPTLELATLKEASQATSILRLWRQLSGPCFPDEQATSQNQTLKEVWYARLYTRVYNNTNGLIICLFYPMTHKYNIICWFLTHRYMQQPCKTSSRPSGLQERAPTALLLIKSHLDMDGESSTGLRNIFIRIFF